MLLYHFPLTSSSATSTIVNKGLKDDYAISGDNNFSSGGKLSAYAKDMGENKFYLSIPNFSLDYTLCFRAKVTSKILLVSVGYTPFEITADNTWHDYVICDKKVYKDGLFLTNYNYSAGIIAFGDSEDSCQGLIQDIRIYDYALSQAEINEYSRALVVHYPLQGNELNDSVLKDVSGFGNDRIFPDNSYYSIINASARGRKSCRCGSKMLGLTNGTQPTGVKGKTMSVWVRQNFDNSSISNWNALYLYRIKDGTISDFCYLSDGSGRSDIWFNKNLYGFKYVVGVWTHFAVVYDGSTCKIYKNGSVVSNKTLVLSDFNLDMIFAGNWNNIPANNGIKDISDFRIYATALSAEDIKNLYNSPISVTKQHQTMAFELKENPLYPSKYWRTPTYAEMNYILNTRTNAANLRTLGRVEISSGTYRNGLFLLPDEFVAPSGITLTIPPTDITTNTFTLQQLKLLENIGVVFFPLAGYRTQLYSPYYQYDNSRMYMNLGGWQNSRMYALYSNISVTQIENVSTLNYGRTVRLIHNGTHFSTSATTKIDFAPANLQYHCTQHIWRFAEHSYDIIGADNANISDSYNGWIDLFGYGTSGVNYSPTLHTTNNADYAQGDIANTDNDWGINEIQSYDYNVKNFSAKKNGIVQHNELRENDSEVNGCYNNKLITNELIEN